MESSTSDNSDEALKKKLEALMREDEALKKELEDSMKMLKELLKLLERKKENASRHGKQPPPPPAVGGNGNIGKRGSLQANDNFSNMSHSPSQTSLAPAHRHTGRIGWDPQAGFDVDRLDDKWKELFSLVGVTAEQMQNKKTIDFIYDFVEKRGGIDFVVREIEKEKATELQRKKENASRHGKQPPPPPAGGGNVDIGKRSSLQANERIKENASRHGKQPPPPPAVGGNVDIGKRSSLQANAPPAPSTGQSRGPPPLPPHSCGAPPPPPARIAPPAPSTGQSRGPPPLPPHSRGAPPSPPARIGNPTSYLWSNVTQ